MFVSSAITTQPNAVASAVTVTSAALSMPARPRIAGFTASMYDIVANVVKPAAISRGSVVLRSRSLKNFSAGVVIRFCLGSGS